MNLQRTAKQLRKEATRNPKKAAFLGLLLVVALWFWAPLVWGWVAADDSGTDIAAVASTGVMPTASPMATSATLPVPIPAQPEAAADDTESRRHTWQELAEWIDRDPRTSAAGLGRGRLWSMIDRWWRQTVPGALLRDPFLTPIVVEEVVEVDPEKVDSKRVKLVVTPQDLGMVLSGTIVGPKRQVARINGRSYERGTTVPAVNNGKEIEFTLAEVELRRVILTRDGREFELNVAAPASSGRIELSKSTN